MHDACYHVLFFGFFSLCHNTHPHTHTHTHTHLAVRPLWESAAEDNVRFEFERIRRDDLLLDRFALVQPHCLCVEPPPPWPTLLGVLEKLLHGPRRRTAEHGLCVDTNDQAHNKHVVCVCVCVSIS